MCKTGLKLQLLLRLQGYLKKVGNMKKSILILVLFLSACTLSNSNKTMFTVSNCQAPCWAGITPGVTTQQEMLDIIKALPSVNQKSINYIDHPGLYSDSRYDLYLFPNLLRSNEGDINIQIDIKNGNVVRTLFTGKMNLTVGEVVEKLGEPTNIITTRTQGDYVGIDVMICNTEIGYGIGLPWFLEEKDLLLSDTKIVGLEFFDITLFQDMVDAGIYSGSIYLWDGYGNVYQKYPLREP